MARSALSSSLAPVAGVFLLSLGLRAAIFLGVRGLEAAQVLGLDAAFYHQRAQMLVEGASTPEGVSFFGPLFPRWLAAAYRIFGANPDVARHLQVVLAAATATLVFVLFRRLASPRVGLGAALVFTLYGYGSFLDTQLVMAPLLALLLAVALYGATRALAARSWRWAGLAGLALGVAAQGRGTFSALALWSAAGLFLLLRTQAPRRRRAGVALALVGGALLGLAPSAWHDLRASGGRSPLPANGGVNLYIGLHENATGRFVDVPGVRFFEEGAREDGGSIAEASRRAGRPLDAVQASRWWTKEALSWAASNPGRAIILTARKLRLALGDTEIAQLENFAWASEESIWLRRAPVRFGWLAGLGLVGVVLLWRDRPESRAALWIAAGYLLLLLPFFVTARYRYPFAVMFAGTSLYTLTWLLRSWRDTRRAPTLTVAGCALALSAFAFLPALPNAQDDALAHAHYTQGVLAMQRGDLPRAILEYREAHANDPTHVPTCANLAWSLLQRGEVEEALRWFARVRELDPGNAVIDGFEGRALLRAGRLDEAEARLRAHLGRMPTDVEAQLDYGDVLQAQGRGALARRHWEYVLREGPTDTLREAARSRLGGAGP